MLLTRLWILRRPGALVGALLLAAASASAAQDSKSAAAASALVKVLEAAQLQNIAAPDPTSADVWLAAMYLKDSQLLVVVSAKYPVPTLLTEKLNTKGYQAIYQDLNAAAVAGTKVFVMDQGADGLNAKPRDDGAPDSWDEQSVTTTFDGDWRNAKLSEDEYLKKFADADSRYARMLSLLAAQAKGGSGT